VPQTYKEAAYSVGISKWRTIYKIVLPAATAGIITGIILGVGRIAGDTAIVWLCLGGSMSMTGPQPWWDPQNWLATMQNTGSTLTTYIYYSSPAGEGNSPNKAFGAGLVLIVIILALNSLVDYLGKLTRIKEE
jgi:phosphate transport system permease protein